LDLNLKNIIVNCEKQVNNLLEGDSGTVEVINVDDMKIDMKSHDSDTMKEKSMILRNNQINLIVYSFLIKDFITLIYVILVLYFIKDEFTTEGYKILAKNNNSTILTHLYFISYIIPVIANYFAFYFLVKDQFKKTKRISKSDLSLLYKNSDGEDIGKNEFRRQSSIREFLH